MEYLEDLGLNLSWLTLASLSVLIPAWLGRLLDKPFLQVIASAWGMALFVIYVFADISDSMDFLKGVLSAICLISVIILCFLVLYLMIFILVPFIIRGIKSIFNEKDDSLLAEVETEVKVDTNFAG